MTPRCRGCGRRLKTASPTGYGPVCERKHLPPPPRRHRTPKRPTSARPAVVRPAPDELSGQESIPLFYLQPTLESL